MGGRTGETEGAVSWEWEDCVMVRVVAVGIGSNPCLHRPA